MIRERKTVVKISSRLCHFSGIVNTFSSPSTIFMAGNAIKTSITIEKTRVSTSSSIFIVPHNSHEESVALLVSEVGVLLVLYCCYRE